MGYSAPVCMSYNMGYSAPVCTTCDNQHLCVQHGILSTYVYVLQHVILSTCVYVLQHGILSTCVYVLQHGILSTCVYVLQHAILSTCVYVLQHAILSTCACFTGLSIEISGDLYYTTHEHFSIKTSKSDSTFWEITMDFEPSNENMETSIKGLCGNFNTNAHGMYTMYISPLFGIVLAIHQ